MRICRTKGLVPELQAAALALLLLCAIPAAHAQNATTSSDAPPAGSLSATIGALLANPKIEGAHWGISVTQLDGTPIYALDDDKLFQPASNVKLFTTAAALGLLGNVPPGTRGPLHPGMQWSTTITLYGKRVDAATVVGTLQITGDGDTFLSDRPVPYDVRWSDEDPPPTLHKLDALAAQIVATGIKTIRGNIEVEDLYPKQRHGEGWNDDDLVWGFAAPVTGLVINDNAVQLTITPGAKPNDPAAITLAPSLPYFSIGKMVQTVAAKQPTHIDVRREGQALRVFGQIAVNDQPDKEHIAIDDPDLYIGTALKTLLASHGVTVTGTVNINDSEVFPPEMHIGTRAAIRQPIHLTPKAKLNTIEEMTAFPCPGVLPLCQSADCNAKAEAAAAEACAPTPKVLELQNPPTSLIDEVTATNKESLNLHAELLLRKLADQGDLYNPDTFTFAQGARVVRQFAINAGVQPDDFYFVDGSGLSTYDLVAPRAITQLLRYAAKQPWGAEYKSSLPIGGVDGTLEHRFTKAPLQGNVFAKTGTLSEDRALSGYVVCASGKTVVFSILVGQHLPGSTAERDVMDRIVAAIAAAN